LRTALDVLRRDTLAIAKAGIEAVDAGHLVERAMTEPVGARVSIIAAGKAAGSMAAAAHRRLGSVVRRALAVAPFPVDLPPPFESVVAGHPVPTAESERAGRRALAIARSLGEADTLLVLLSGGASSLMAVPADGITLDDKRMTTERLQHAGADIHALNTVRKHLSSIKGGWLGVSTVSRCRTLAVSDVVGDDLSVIGSGPTVPDPSRFGNALALLQRFGGLEAYPSRVVSRLRAGHHGEIAETPKPGDVRLANATASVIGGRADAMAGAARAAAALGYRVVRVDEAITGEARDAARAHVERVLVETANADQPLCVVSSGETTVRVTGRGRGGRNQEFALAAAERLARHGPLVAMASLGTDGIDGPTDAAGAIVDTQTVRRAVERGLREPQTYLDDNDAYTFFDAMGDLVTIGATGTNVGDLQVMLVAPTDRMSQRLPVRGRVL